MSSGSEQNPTKLRVGMSGWLAGETITVVGRAVLESAEHNRWNEYYVKGAGDRLFILVYERGVWKRFDDFTPQQAISANEAASYRSADRTVFIDSEAFEINYISISRVLFSEGQAIEGVRTGSQAHYFNATRAHRLLVVSWTGSEIEFYRGEKITSGVVETAFQLPAASLWTTIASKLQASGDQSSRLPVVIFWVSLVLFACFLLWAMTPRETTVEPPPIVLESPQELADSATVRIGATRYTILKHSLKEIDEMVIRFRRWEYDLVDDQGYRALLVEALNGSSKEWHLFRPITVPAAVTPNIAGKMRVGSRIQLGPDNATVQTLFLCHAPDSTTDVQQSWLLNPICYGFIARNGDTWVLARWSESTVELEMGKAVSEAEIKRSFAPSIAK